ncbi:MAG: HD domain-containing protein [Deltaproteobacteria bacterium]|nr:HD domain-containing protein [Deltaproteobacteria bacterium]
MRGVKEKDIIPSAGQCIEIMKRHNMRANIMRHSIRVRDVAVFIAAKLVEAGHELDLSLVEAAALLHDITKTRCLSTGERHAETGRRLLEEMGYHRVAQVVGSHVRLHGWRTSRRITEDAVVNYADKRVMHDRIVDLDRRYADLRARYGTNPKALAYLQQMEAETREVEREIFAVLDVDPSAALGVPYKFVNSKLSY